MQCKSEYFPIFQLQFDPKLLDNNNKSAMDIAREQQKENPEIMQYLEGRIVES